MSPALHSACSFLVASFNGTTIPMLDMSDSSTGSSNTRTLWDIIWSCAVTLFACAWTAIHPNIPGMDEGKVAIFSRRLLIMAIVLIAPEFIIAWAMRQFLSARRTANEFDDILGAQLLQAQAHHQNIGDGNTATLLSEMAELERNSLIPNPPRVASRKFRAWTVTHGFFACMGGFLLYVNDEPRAPLAPDELWRFVRKGSVDMPTIVEADIEDRSKGDILSKGIAILQLVWFVISLAARYAQNLPITLLEIDTLAIAALTCIVYSLWWKKPKDVGRPFPVHWKKMEPSPPSDLVYGEASVEDGYFLYFIRNLLNTESQFSHRAAHSRGASSLGGYYHATTDGFDDDDTVVLLIGCFKHAADADPNAAGLSRPTVFDISEDNEPAEDETEHLVQMSGSQAAM
ncbi:hypothetical protein K503DRAFT_865460 [Rhizopogon vinicolor AM-OR11-026]|uniref:Uncharacterized protein n=1 Tax=Rhizopogon vinicolor AM-OR11-026 TaxID=1314800 RepID=A0A1B7N3G7_9AGAM|nr:hypothetical protein K503DRAFT_865460 [Rhizopogon vinicolor AM-OR11-026]